ncbi:P-II family nitrogen regulator [Clostridium pasteurianum]|uniref:Nitrogen regulatory protein PII n=1 Tax=Clostridium pasteurianum BC1 TaxID=86416 RepID=R4K8V6_CLOPA|nr:P-II family nitrogen regulator [Clostridium pasteurianum]AGK98136.1 nitrogen regulatory protein PII [Clostridium pasteurianum BC1]
MLIIKAVIRPEKVNEVLAELNEAGFPAVTKYDVVGRGKQQGITAGAIHYDEIPKEMLMIGVNDEDKDDVLRIILSNARTGEKGNFGDGKIFISSLDEVYTISSGLKGL